MTRELANGSVHGAIDTTYQTQQRDMFASGLAAQIGVNALGVWLAIKSHADFATGEAWPGVRRLMEVTGLASATTQKAIDTLMDAHLLRISRKVGQRHYYIARERMDVRVGPRVICTVVVDYVPNTMRERLAKLAAAASSGDMSDEDVWAEVDILPGPGFTWDQERKALRGRMRADEAQPGIPAKPSPAAIEHRQEARQLADELRGQLGLVHKPRNTR